MTAPKGDFFGDGEVVLEGIAPINQVNGLGRPSGLGLDLHAVAHQPVHGLVVSVESPVAIGGFSAQFQKRRADLGRSVPASFQVAGEDILLDIAVVRTVGPVAEIAVAQAVLEQPDDALLRYAFRLADRAHDDPLNSLKLT